MSARALLPKLGVAAPRLIAQIQAKSPDPATQWRELSGCANVGLTQARRDFSTTLGADTDLSHRQVAQLVRKLLPDDGAGLSLDTTLRDVQRRYLRFVDPWIPLWRAYVAWALHWCAQHGYQQIAFLCRDAFPLYLIARQMQGHAQKQNGDRQRLSLLHASRRLVGEEHFVRHFERVLKPGCRTALVDSGCYGSLIPELSGLVRARSGFTPAVFFFYSRNPNIFGYMNYLMSWSLLGPRRRSARTSMEDFVIFAGDFLESQPKPFRVCSLEADGEVRVMPQDPVSFALGCALAAEIETVSEHPPDCRCYRDEAHRHATSLWQAYCNRKLHAGLLISAVAPQVVPSAAAFRLTDSFPPQDAIFGLRSGST